MMISNWDKMACIDRELKMRKRVFPRLVMHGRMTAIEAEREISIMVAIAEDYRRLVQPPLLLESK
jgi:hypothetical protein